MFFLQDILENESINLDWMFRYSLINDIVKVRATPEPVGELKTATRRMLKRGESAEWLSPSERLPERSLVDAAFSSLVCRRDTQSKQRNRKISVAMVPREGLVKEWEMQRKREATDRETRIYVCAGAQVNVSSLCRWATAGFRRDDRQHGEKCPGPQRAGDTSAGGGHVFQCLPTSLLVSLF